MDFINGVLGLALLAVATVKDWLDQLPGWYFFSLIALLIVVHKSNVVERIVTEAMTELRAIRESAEKIRTEISEVKTAIDGLET